MKLNSTTLLIVVTKKGAIEFLKKHVDKLDVNYEYQKNIPIFLAIKKQMLELFDAIVKCKGFDSNVQDGFGETLLNTLLYLRGANKVQIMETDILTTLDKMIKIILESKFYDFNSVSINNETAINVACNYRNLLWVVEELSKKKDVNPNIIDDFKYAALTHAIKQMNIGAIRCLSKRKDVIVREIDLKSADENKINLVELGFEI